MGFKDLSCGGSREGGGKALSGSDSEQVHCLIKIVRDGCANLI